MGTPAATIVIPCFNHGRFLREAVDSALAQSGVDARVVVVNDGSDDGLTPAVCDAVAGERVTVVHQENRGLSGARNRGAADARTEYLVFLDADDYLRPTFVSTLGAALESDAGDGRVSHVYCQEELVELGTGIWKVPEWDPLLLMVTNLHPVTALVKRSCFEEVGGFDETMRSGYEDWEFWLRLAERGYRGIRVREPLFVWRRHCRTTMVMESIKRHDELYAQIMLRRGKLYMERGTEAMVLANSLLRKFDCNWLDESGFPLSLLYLWGCRDRLPGLEGELTGARAQSNALRLEAGTLRAELARVEGRLAEMESSAAVRWRRSLGRTTARLPGPVTGALRAILRLFKRIGASGP